MPIIIPSVTAKTVDDFYRLYDIVRPLSDHIHLDFADGSITRPTTVLPRAIKRQLSGVGSVHLMTKCPLAWRTAIKIFRPQWVSIHLKPGLSSRTEIIGFRNAGYQVIGVLSPRTPVNVILKNLPLLAGIQVMGVIPGRYRAPFLRNTYARVKQVKKLVGSKTLIVDGGVNKTRVLPLLRAGATTLIVGSDIAFSPNPSLEFRRLIHLAKRQ